MKMIRLVHSLAFALPVFLAIHLTAFAEAPPPTGLLTVSVLGLKSTHGKVIVNLFRKDDDLFGQPHLQRVAVITQTTATLKFPELPFASYTVFAYHDENNNGTLDHNFFRLPKEPMGYSNHWHFSLITGMPTFEKTQFYFTGVNTTVSITVR